MKAMNKHKKISVIPISMMGVLGIFIPVLKELKDISYQLDRDYFFNSNKFNKRFCFTPTHPEIAIKEMLNWNSSHQL